MKKTVLALGIMLTPLLSFAQTGIDEAKLDSILYGDYDAQTDVWSVVTKKVFFRYNAIGLLSEVTTMKEDLGIMNKVKQSILIYNDQKLVETEETWSYEGVTGSKEFLRYKYDISGYITLKETSYAPLVGDYTKFSKIETLYSEEGDTLEQIVYNWNSWDDSWIKESLIEQSFNKLKQIVIHKQEIFDYAGLKIVSTDDYYTYEEDSLVEQITWKKEGIEDIREHKKQTFHYDYLNNRHVQTLIYAKDDDWIKTGEVNYSYTASGQVAKTEELEVGSGSSEVISRALIAYNDSGEILSLSSFSKFWGESYLVFKLENVFSQTGLQKQKQIISFGDDLEDVLPFYHVHYDFIESENYNYFKDFGGEFGLDNKKKINVGEEAFYEDGTAILISFKYYYSDKVQSKREINTSAVSIFPNPAHDFIQVSSDEFDAYEVVNVTGSTVISGNITSAKINIESLSSGVYYLLLKNKLNQVTKPFVVK